MTPAVSNIAWGPGEDGAAAAAMARSGFSHMEAAPGRLFRDPPNAAPSEIDEAREAWSSRGIGIVAMQSLLYGTTGLALFEGDPAREAMALHLRAIFAMASRLGARALVLGSPGNRRRGRLPPGDAFASSLPFLSEMARHAHGSGCVLCLEPNASAYGCDFVTTLAEARRVVEAVDHPGLRIQVDAGSMCLEGEPAGLAVEAPDLIGHVHLSEPHLAPVGTGGADIAGLLRALRGVGYAGTVSIEMRATAGAGVAPVESALRHVRDLLGTAR